MRLSRISDNYKVHRGDVCMQLVCKDEVELQSMMDELNKRWYTECSLCSDDGNDMTWYVTTCTLDFFKMDYKEVKAQLKGK